MHVWPAVYALMPNRQRATYERLFALVKSKLEDIAGESFSPPFFVSDYERASINAFRALFPASAHRSCHFHFVQVLWRNFPSNLQSLYTLQPQGPVRRMFQRLSALALMPLESVPALYNFIVAQAPEEDGVSDFLHYFDENWMIETAQRKRADWNHFKEYAFRTQNHMEGFHVLLRKWLNGATDPHLFRLITAFQELESSFRTKAEQVALGKSLPSGKPEYKRMNERYRELVRRWSVHSEHGAEVSKTKLLPTTRSSRF